VIKEDIGEGKEKLTRTIKITADQSGDVVEGPLICLYICFNPY